MKRSLGRLLQIRELLEEVSRVDLEKKHSEVVSIESAAQQQRLLALEARAEAMRILAQDSGEEVWQLQMADAEILSGKQERLRALAAAGQPAVERARDELLARRMERRQVEALIRSAEREEKQVERRREQQRADEWYQSRSPRGTGKVRTVSRWST